MTTDWNPLLRHEFEQPYWQALQSFVARERGQHTVYPAHDDVFAALHHTSYASTRVVILGQDPYHGPGQAHGLCFSVQREVALPPSLVNIFKELQADLGIPVPSHGNWQKNHCVSEHGMSFQAGAESNGAPQWVASTQH